jgi:hypothetical protein
VGHRWRGAEASSKVVREGAQPRSGVTWRWRRSGGATAFREADSGENGGISGGAAGAARRRGRGELDASISRRNSKDGLGRQGAATLISARRSGRKRLDVAELGCGAR